MDPLALADRTARSFALTLRLLPGPTRAEVCLAYLAARLTDSVADTTSLAAADRLSLLDALRDAIDVEGPWPAAELSHLATVHDHPGEMALLSEHAELESALRGLEADARDRVRRVLLTIVSGQRLDLVRLMEGAFTLADEAALVDYTWRVAGCVGGFWTEVLAARLPGSILLPEGELAMLGRRYGQGLQLLNILRDAPEDWLAGRCYLPADVGETVPPSPPDAQGLEICYQRMRNWLPQCREWIDDGIRYGEALRGIRVRAASRLPAIIGHRTLDRIETSDFQAWRQRIRIPRHDVRRALFEAMVG
ncbi:MAG: squalene/phytoene synthase family protein [Verrucomicrobiales bacterium]